MLTEKEFTYLINLHRANVTMSNKDIAFGLKVSVPTLERWLAGITIPAELGRQPVIDWLEKHRGM